MPYGALATGALTLSEDQSTFTIAAGTSLIANGAVTLAGAITQSGVQTPSGGVAVASGTTPTTWNTAQLLPSATTTGTEYVAVVTETAIAEVFIPINCTLTGVSILNATAVAGSIVVALYNSAGTVVANSALAGTAASGTGAYQQVPFTATYAAKGPARYYIGLQANNTGYKFRTLVVGNCMATAKTGEVFGTLTSIAATVATTAFTTGKGPIASTY